jgi:hypothetical protein
LVGLIFLAGSTDDMLYHQLEAYGGYLETIFFGALLTLLATLIARYPQPGGVRNSEPGANDAFNKFPSGLAQRSLRHHLLLFAAWGIAAGLAIYSDPLVLPFVGLSGLLIVLMQWRAMRGWLGVVALLGLLVGVSPWLVYIVTAPSLNAAQSFLKPASHTTAAHAPPGPGLGERITDQALGTVFISIPNNTGVNALCPLTANDAWPLAHWTTPHVAGCMALRGAWGTGIIALLIAALALEGSPFWALWRRGSGSWTAANRTRAALAGGRIVAVGAPMATVLLFALSSSAGTSPWIYSRYLISLAIALPVAVAVLWQHAPRPALPLWHPVQWRRLGIVMLSGFLALALALGVAGTFTEAHAQQIKTQQEMALVGWLETNNHTRFYSNFWTCMRLIFQSNERLVCSIITDQLAITPNRYAPYDATVTAAHPTLYLFPADTVMARDFPAYAAQQGWHLTTTMLTFDGQYAAYELEEG